MVRHCSIPDDFPQPAAVILHLAIPTHFANQADAQRAKPLQAAKFL